jgi:hypothetical protein
MPAADFSRDPLYIHGTVDSLVTDESAGVPFLTDCGFTEFTLTS